MKGQKPSISEESLEALRDAYSTTRYGNTPEKLDRQVIISPDALQRDARREYKAKLKVLGVTWMPIVIDGAINPHDRGTSVESTDQLYGMEELSQKMPHYFVAGPRAHRWDMAYMMATSSRDEALEGRVRITDPVLVAENERLAKLAHIDPPPELYYLTQEDTKKFDSRSYSDKTLRGVRYIVLDPNDPQDVQLGWLAHEYGHHWLKHTELKNKMDDHNTQSDTLPRQREHEADMFAIQQACRGEELITALKSQDVRDRAAIEKKYGANAYTYDMQNAIAQEHEPLFLRIPQAIEATRAMAGKCPLPTGVTGGQDVKTQGAPTQLRGTQSNDPGMAP